jgi:COMPASS component SWD3
MTFKPTATCTGHEGTVAAVKFSNEGSMIASCSADRTCRVWNISANSPEARQTLAGHENGVSDVCWHPSEPYVATASDDLTLGLWDVTTGQRLRTFRGHTHFAFCCKFHNFGSILVRFHQQ